MRSSRRQRGGGGGGASVVPNRNQALLSATSSEQSSSSFAALGKVDHVGARPKWFPSWRRLRKCLLPPFALEPPVAQPQLHHRPSEEDAPSDASSSVPTRQLPSSGSDGSASHHHHHTDDEAEEEGLSRSPGKNPNNLVSSPMSLSSSESESSSWSASPPPPPPICLVAGADPVTSLVHPLSEEDEVVDRAKRSLDDDGRTLRPAAEAREGPQSEVGRGCPDEDRSDDLRESLPAPRASEEALEPKSISFQQKHLSNEAAVRTVPEAQGALEAADCDAAASSSLLPRSTPAAKPGTVRRTFTEALPASTTANLSRNPTPTPPASLVAPDLKSASASSSATSRPQATDLGIPGGAEPRSLSARPSMVRRGCSVPVMGAAPPPTLPSSAKLPLSPTSARLSLLPPKAPLTSSGGGGAAAAGRPSIVARRISSTATGGGPHGGGMMRPRLGSSGGESNLTSSSRHRRSNNSFEFSVDSLHRVIRDPDSDDDPALLRGSQGGGTAAAAAAAAAADARVRQVSENSWSTMPVASIQIGTLERDCSELVSDDFWEVDSLIMSSDGEDEGDDPESSSRQGAVHPASGYDTVDESDHEDESDSDKDNGMSPSPTSVMDDTESRGKNAQEVAEPPDWMLQWAQQPGSPHRQGEAAEQGEIDPTPAVPDEPTYLPSGPKPQGCVFSTYVAVSMGEPRDGDTPDECVRLVQVMSGKVVVEGRWEIELDRDTRIQPICEEDRPHRVVLVKHNDKEWRLNPVPVIATRGGGFRLAALKSQSRGSALGSSGGWDDATHYEADWSVVGPSPGMDDDSQQCEAALHLVFLLDAIRRQGQAQ